MVKISVLMPIYNTPLECLKGTIESILNQSDTDFEFLILNDSSTDKDNEKLVKSYYDKRIKYYRVEYLDNHTDVGVVGTRCKIINKKTLIKQLEKS